MSDLVRQLRALLAEAGSNYINVAKVAAVLDRFDEEHDRHAQHPKLWVHGQRLCACGEWMPGMASIALPVETPFIRALGSAISAYARVLEGDDRGDINACLLDALLAALKTYGIDPGDWFAEAYGEKER